MTITLRAATDEYRTGWERIFSKRRLDFLGGTGENWYCVIEDYCAPLRLTYTMPSHEIYYEGGPFNWPIRLTVREHYEPIGDEL